MKIATIMVRSLLGLMFTVFGLNIFFNFMPQPPPSEGPARNFITALAVSHYSYVVGALEVVGGALLVAGRFVPLGLTLLGPVIVNILCVHVFLEPSGLPMAIVVSALALFLLWRYREHFAGLVKSVPARAESGNHRIVAGASSASHLSTPSGAN
jgi:putative oxidoreductase